MTRWEGVGVETSSNTETKSGTYEWILLPSSNVGSHSSLENRFKLWWGWKDVALGGDSFEGVMCTAHPLLMVCLRCESETYSLLCKVESKTENWFEVGERKESCESVCNPNPILIFTSLPCLLALGTWQQNGTSLQECDMSQLFTNQMSAGRGVFWDDGHLHLNVIKM